jgi:hypothetical protein
MDNEDFFGDLAWARFQSVICEEADQALAECKGYLADNEDRWMGFATAFVILIGSQGAFEERYPDAPKLGSPLWTGSLAAHVVTHAFAHKDFKNAMDELERIIDIHSKAEEN